MRRSVVEAALSASLTAVLLACDSQPVGVRENPPAANLAQSSVRADFAGIAALVEDQLAAWNAKDATAFAATYTEDAVFYDPIGGVAEGRDGVRALHSLLFGGPFAPSTETQVIVAVRPLTGTIAVVHLHAALSGYAALPPGLDPTEPGVVRTTKTWVVVKRGGSWLIHTQHMAPIAPVP